jgi:hypothetical protein
MSYAQFKEKVKEFASKAGVSAPKFSHKDGKHFAVFPEDGVTITGNTKALSLSVNWGSGHRAYV